MYFLVLLAKTTGKHWEKGPKQPIQDPDIPEVPSK
jgi:hypothetical protein